MVEHEHYLLCETVFRSGPELFLMIELMINSVISSLKLPILASLVCFIIHLKPISLSQEELQHEHIECTQALVGVSHKLKKSVMP